MRELEPLGGPDSVKELHAAPEGGRLMDWPSRGRRPMSRMTMCPCCEGEGCEGCDFTGQRVTTYIEDKGGVTMRVHGSAPLTAETEKALLAVARAAYDRMDEERADAR